MEKEQSTQLDLKDLLSEEINDITEILANEQMTDKSRQKLVDRVRKLSEVRETIIQKNTEQ